MRPIHHSMLRRCKTWDYHAPRIYTITITLENRRLPLLGNLRVTSPPNTPPELLQAYIEPTELGKVVSGYWDEIAVRNPEIRILGFQLMEEHLHGTLYVTIRIPRHLGEIIGGFKSACTVIYRQMTGLKTKLFSSGFQDTILFHEGQLERMLTYLADNPRRLAVRRFYPEYFQHLQDIPFLGGALNGIGNPFLLSAPVFFPVQASRNITSAELSNKQAEMFQKISEGAVIVSPCISSGEQILTRQVFEAHAPLIALRNMCFSSLCKPPGAYFDACANGKLLMMAPSQWHFQPGKKPMTRNDACVLNAIAAAICGQDIFSIHYMGYVPPDLQELIAQAIGKK